MNKDRTASAMETKLIEDYLASKAVEYKSLAEVFHKDDEVMIKYYDSKAREKVKTVKATELIAFAYDKSKNFSSGAILKEVQTLVGKALVDIEKKVVDEIDRLTKETAAKIDKSLSEKGKEGNSTAWVV